MIQLSEFINNVNEMMKEFKESTNALFCSLIDKDGFIVANEKKDIMNERKIIELYNSIETLIESECLVCKNNKGLITIGFKTFEREYLILFNKISETLTFIGVIPTDIAAELITTEYGRVMNKMSDYLTEMNKNMFLNIVDIFT